MKRTGVPATDFERMNALLRNRPEFADYISKQRRMLELRQYDERIEALSRARALLDGTTIHRMPKSELRSAEAVCRAHGWSKEDAAYFVEDFQARCPPPGDGKKADKASIAAGVTRIASALLHS